MKTFEEILKSKVKHITTMTDYNNILEAQKEYENQSRQAALSGSLQSEAVEFAEWIRTFEALERKEGFWMDNACFHWLQPF